MESRINVNTNLLATIYGEYQIFDGLSYKLQVGANLNFNNNDFFSPKFQDGDISFYNETLGDGFQARGNQTFSEITRSTNKFVSTTLTNTLNFSKKYGKHDIGATAVFEQFDTTRETVNAGSQDPTGSNLDQLTNVSSSISSRTEEDLLLSYLGRVTYAFDNKYLLTGSIRRDGSSRFGANELWGVFPAGSVAWRISEENFLQSSSVISDLKLRASFGITGNNNIGLYQAQSDLLFPSGSYIVGSGSGLVPNSVALGVANPDLKWERTTTFNLGADFGFFNNAFTLVAEYYQRQGDDLLISQVLAPSLGFFTPQTSNSAAVETSGLEFTVGYKDNVGDFTWGLDLNFSTQENEVTSTGTQEQIFSSTFDGEAINIVKVGEPQLSFFGWQTDGIFQTADEIANAPTQVDLDAGDDKKGTKPGDIKFVDTNGDGKVTDADRVILGNPSPDFTYTANLNVAYKGIDLSVFVYGSQGNEILNTFKYDLLGSGRLFNASPEVLNSWTPDNTNTNQPRIAKGDPNRNVRISDRYIEDGSFARIKTVTLGYSIPQDALDNTLNGLFSKCRVYIQGQNLATFTDYSGFDPEIPSLTSIPFSSNGPVVELGVDRGYYPRPQTFIMGLQLEF